MTSQSQAAAPDPIHPTEHLSAVMDGEADDRVLKRVCEAWREQTGTRQAWHAYHLIGDVLRSEELSSDAELDSAFLRRLRARLADEPVVLAPAAGLPAARRVFVRQRARWQAWSASAAVAAGFVAVAGVLLVTQEQTPQQGDLVAAVPAAPPDTGPVLKASLGPTGPEPSPAAVATGGSMLRNALVDRYLQAHKRLGISNMAAPSPFVQSTADTTQR